VRCEVCPCSWLPLKGINMREKNPTIKNIITYRKGDVLKALKKNEIDIVAHGCNCSGGFGSGIAGQIAKLYPKVRNEYIFQYHAKNFELGKIHPIQTEDGIIVNCATQQEYGRNPGSQPNGRYCDYIAIEECMQKLASYIHDKKLRLGMPMIGAGLAGGNWKAIEIIINRTFNDEVFIYKL